MEIKLLPVNKKEIITKLYVACRTCYNAGTPTDMWRELEENPVSEEKMLKLIERVISSGHHSTLEHVQLTFLISGVSRSLSHQLVRHRMASYCVSGDTVVKSNLGSNRIIKDLFNLPQQQKSKLKIRTFDEKTLELSNNPVREIIFSGEKEVWEIKTRLGYSIKATQQHRFWTNEGWKRLIELEVGEDVYTNGIPAYQDRDWLYTHYRLFNETLKDISQICGVSPHTIRKWARKFNIQKETGKGMTGRVPPNKGKTKEDYEPMKRTSEKMMGNKNFIKMFGEQNPQWKGDNIDDRCGYRRTRAWYKKTGICSYCGSEEHTELHHIDRNPKNTSKENIVELCVSCHKKIHRHECKVLRPDKIISIKKVGIEETYDICMDGPNHNFIANGFAVHNSQQSQRYCTFENGKFDYVIPQMIRGNEYTLGLFEGTMAHLAGVYSKLIQAGIPAEDARAVLPNACCTNLTWSVNIRELMHVCNERLCSCAQSEIRVMTQKIRLATISQLPFLKPYLVPKCEMLGYCNESKQRSCGRKKVKEVVIPKEEYVLSGGD